MMRSAPAARPHSGKFSFVSSSIGLGLLATTVATQVAVAQPADPATAAPAATPTAAPAPEAALTSDLPDKASPRVLAQALVTEGVAQYKAGNFDQALANFLAAYDRFPAPNVLLNIGSTLVKMGRLADAANTYQKFLDDPNTTPEYGDKVRAQLAKLDEHLVLLTVNIAPANVEVALDGPNWVPVGTSLVTRINAGIHMVRVRKANLETAEQTINAFEGEKKTIAMALKVSDVATAPGPEPAAPPVVNAWLSTGTNYSLPAASQSGGGAPSMRVGWNGLKIQPVVRQRSSWDDDIVVPVEEPEASIGIRIGAAFDMRIDTKEGGVGAAAGGTLGITDHFELRAEGMFTSPGTQELGGLYIGGRYIMSFSLLHPYLTVGSPLFFKDGAQVGVRGGGGIELDLTSHLSVLGEVGGEYFFNPKGTFDHTFLVPSVGVVGRL